MNKIVKKSIAIIICLTFLMLAVTSSSGVTVNQMKSDAYEQVGEIKISTKIVTVFRCGPDGSVKPIELNLEYEESQDIGDALLEQCDELLENDEEIQELINQNNNTFGFVVRINSKGRGFHYKTMLLEKIYLRYLLWKLTFPRIATLLAKPFVFCRYAKDLTAKTIIKHLLRKNETERVIEGAHSVFVNSFIGYTTWIGRFAYAPMTFIPRVFSGYGRFVFTNKL